jgi:hypothetical protein
VWLRSAVGDEMTLRTSATIGVGYVALTWALFWVGCLASDWKNDWAYTVWAGSGITFFFLLLGGGAASTCLLVAALWTRKPRIAVPGAILLVGCVLPLYLILGVGLLVFGL